MSDPQFAALKRRYITRACRIPREREPPAGHRDCRGALGLNMEQRLVDDSGRKAPFPGRDCESAALRAGSLPTT
jgi:hypothetical protein